MASPQSPAPQPTRPPLVLDELIAELSWPRLWRAGRLALRPARVGLAAFYILGAMLVLSAAHRWLDRDPAHDTLREHGALVATGFSTFVSSARRLDFAASAMGLLTTFVGAPAACFRQAPVVTVLAGLVLLVWTALVGGAISRSAATELAWSRTLAWPSAVGLALGRWRSLVGAVLLPLAAVWVVGLGLGLAGWALFNVGALSVLGGLFWGVFLALGVAAAGIMLAMALGHLMLVPAVVCEGADAIDAVQHSFGMVLSRPLRLLVYLAILAFQGALLGLAVGIIAVLAIAFARLCAGAWVDEAHRVILHGAGVAASDEGLASAPRSWKAGAGLVRITTAIFIVIAAAVMVSYLWCAATALFLVMRRVCDGQEISELWSPGMVEGTTSPSRRDWQGGPGGTPTGAAGEGIVDDGPADEG